MVEILEHELCVIPVMYLEAFQFVLTYGKGL